MRTFQFNKIVGYDVIQDMINGGDIPIYTKLTGAKLIEVLLIKYSEEEKEFISATSKPEKIKELGDMFLVQKALMEVLSNDQQKITSELLSEKIRDETMRIDEYLYEKMQKMDWYIKGAIKNLGETLEALEEYKGRGGFSEGYWINTVQVHEDNPWIKHYEKNPDKYPEIKEE